MAKVGLYCRYGRYIGSNMFNGVGQQPYSAGRPTFPNEFLCKQVHHCVLLQQASFVG